MNLWTGNSRTDSPSNRFYASLAIRMFRLSWIRKQCGVFLHSDNCTTTDISKFYTHHSFYWLSVKSLPANYIFIHSDHCRLHFYNIRQCQLIISWVTMVTCGPIVFPKVLWMQHLQVIFDFNDRADIQINVNGNNLIQKWNCPLFSSVMFFQMYYQRENVNTKGIMWVKAPEGTAMPCETT